MRLNVTAALLQGRCNTAHLLLRQRGFGGIKLQVERKYVAWALEILATDYSAELSALDDEEN